jgi:hypothetical protein
MTPLGGFLSRLDVPGTEVNHTNDDELQEINLYSN